MRIKEVWWKVYGIIIGFRVNPCPLFPLYLLMRCRSILHDTTGTIINQAISIGIQLAFLRLTLLISKKEVIPVNMRSRTGPVATRVECLSYDL